MRPRSLDRSSFLWSSGAAACALLPLAHALPPWLLAAEAALFAVGIALGLRGRALPSLLRWLLTLSLAGLILWDFGLLFGRSFGRDTAAALLTAMLTLKVLELRSVRDARTLNSFALFAIMAAFLQDRGPLTLALALLATLAGLAALHRLAERETPPRATAPLAPAARLAFAGRLLLLSVPLALAAFFLFPRLPSPLWGVPDTNREGRTGLSDTMAPGDVSRLYLDDSPILRARFDGPLPAIPQRYWRGPVLSQFDGRRWSRSQFLAALPPATLEQGDDGLAYELQQEPTDRRYVFALDVPIEAPDGATMALERTVLSQRPLHDISRHRLRSALNYRMQANLPTSLAQGMTRLPAGFNPRAVTLARQWRAEAGNDDRAVIQRALALFNAEFRYTLEPPRLGYHSVDEFVFETRAGYCEHYASAFAVLMRAAGIPARVVTGYHGGELNTVGSYLLVRQSDAHAWNEVWLAGLGWVRIDPTSAVAPHRIEQGVEALGGADRHGWLGQTWFDTADWVRRGWNEFVLGYDALRQRQLLAPLGVDAQDWRQLAAVFAGGITLALLATVLLLLRRPPSSPDPLVRAWHRFVRRLARAGVAKRPYEGPVAFSRRAAAQLPQAAAAILELSEGYARQRYAGERPDPAERRQLAASLRRFRLARRSS